MLRRLTVENYALIERLELELDSRLNIITGETGAGKSILLGALGLLLGNKNDGTALKEADRNCVVEGEFDIEGYGLEPLFEEHDLDYDAHTVVRRVITPAGKSRAYVNDLPVQLAQLRELGRRLIDIHSQHQNLVLSSEEFRTQTLDTVAANAPLLARYAARYAALGGLRRRLAELEQAAREAARDEEWLRFQCDELSAAQLREGETAELEAEQSVLAHADRIGEVLAAARNAFDRDETGILAQLKQIENEIARLGEYPAAAELAARLHAAGEELKDIDATVASDSERIESDPERLQRVTERLDALYTLVQKHRVNDEAELIARRDELAARLLAIDRSDEEIDALRREIDAATNEVELLASELHRARAKAVPGFERQITALLVRLGMPDTVFRIALTDTGAPTRTGRDEVAFLFSANRSMAPQPVERIASGGETSRVMLALKALLARRTKLPTILFDEIDTGVSGRIADAMGEIIASLAETMQVVDITHLPQVASKGTAHFVVFKHDSRTRIRRLDDEERITEIAKMLSGSEITEAATAQARILLGH